MIPTEIKDACKKAANSVHDYEFYFISPHPGPDINPLVKMANNRMDAKSAYVWEYYDLGNSWKKELTEISSKHGGFCTTVTKSGKKNGFTVVVPEIDIPG